MLHTILITYGYFKSYLHILIIYMVLQRYMGCDKDISGEM